MEIQESLKNLTESSTELENIFLYLGECFTKLMKKQNSKSLDKLNDVFSQLDQLNKIQIEKETNFFVDFNSKYSNFYDSLNNSISELNNISSQVSELKDISEEMELIALNAMVISIKSGEQGRAFSKITENLKRLSTMMNNYAQKLIFSEQELLSNITELKNLYEKISTAENNIENISNSVSETIKDMLISSSTSLQEIVNKSQEIYQPIINAMEGLQLQDIIKQSLDQIHLILSQSAQTEATGRQSTVDTEEQLDNLSFEISVFELSSQILNDINQKLLESSNIFKSNWSVVSQILSEVEESRKKYISMFIDSSSENNEKNLIHKLTIAENKYSNMIEEFATYQQSQKTMCVNCKTITKKVLTIHDIFEELEPILAQLHHVRILQEIEVSKNLAISTVKNFVNDMDKLIVSAQDSLEQMDSNVDDFIDKIHNLLKNFTNTINDNTEQMDMLKKQKNSFFDNLANSRLEISYTMHGFAVFPEDFTETCENVSNKLENIEQISKIFDIIIEKYKDLVYIKTSERQKLFDNLNINSWEIKNNKLKEIIKQFTITSHKETAGKIAGFQVEAGHDAGEITFF